MAWHVIMTPPRYISLAKIVAGGQMWVGASNVGYQENLKDSYGTIIEALESNEMRRRALERVRILYPDLREADVDVRVSQDKGTAIFNVAAVGSEKDFTKNFLNALLDEFKWFRKFNREQQRNTAVQAQAEDVAKSDYVSVMGRASTAVEDVHAAAVPAIIAGIGGFVGGWVLLLSGAALWVAAGPRRDRVPPLPSA